MILKEKIYVEFIDDALFSELDIPDLVNLKVGDVLCIQYETEDCINSGENETQVDTVPITVYSMREKKSIETNDQELSYLLDCIEYAIGW